MDRIALDASVIAVPYLPEVYSDWVRKRVEEYDEYHVLDLTLYELCNVLWKRAYLTHELRMERVEVLWRNIERFVEILCAMHRYDEVLNQALGIALTYGITIYDASYVALARRVGVKLATLDRKLVQRLGRIDLCNVLVHPVLRRE